jgi:hypothetical protein
MRVSHIRGSYRSRYGFSRIDDRRGARMLASLARRSLLEPLPYPRPRDAPAKNYGRAGSRAIRAATLTGDRSAIAG